MTDPSPHDICGSTDTDSGDPCQRPAGWGTDRDNGPCTTHRGDGRPSKLSKQRQENIASMIEQGHSMTAAARASGINKATLFNWMSRGESDKAAGKDNEHTEFFDRITRARGEGEAMYVNQIRVLAQEANDTAALISMLKQRYPDSWGDVDRGEQEGGVNVYTEAPETIELEPIGPDAGGDTDGDGDE